MKFIKFYFVALTLLSGIFTNAQTWADTVAKIEKAFVRYKPTGPGAQLAISRNGQVIYTKAWGMADLEHNAQLQTISPTEAGSVSKQFTAAAILLLEQEGKLSLDDDVRKHLPELPDYGHVITLRHMMQHTSGLKDWGALAAVAGWPRSTKTYDNDDAVFIMSKQKTLNNKPGAEYIYSNSNYNAFAVIVQRVSGKSLAQYTKEKIFVPAGMTHTEWRDDFKRVVPNRAMAYSKSGPSYLTNMPNEYVYGNGGLLTTAEDLVKWTHYYQSGKFGNPSLLQVQTTSSLFNNGAQHNYAAGLFITRHNGVDLITHDGATASYRANLDNFPTKGLAIAFLSNTSEFDRDTLFIPDIIRDIFIGEGVAAVAVPIEEDFFVDPAKLVEYTGWYRNTRSGNPIRLTVKDGKLTGTQVGALRPIGADYFSVGNGPSKVRFLNGKNRQFIFISATRDSVYFDKVDSANVSADAMEEFEGEYYSEEADARISVKMKNNKLVMFQAPNTEFPLTPTYRDGFDAPMGGVSFQRGKDKKISGFGISVSRARNVQFNRVGK